MHFVCTVHKERRTSLHLNLNTIRRYFCLDKSLPAQGPHQPAAAEPSMRAEHISVPEDTFFAAGQCRSPSTKSSGCHFACVPTPTSQSGAISAGLTVSRKQMLHAGLKAMPKGMAQISAGLIASPRCFLHKTLLYCCRFLHYVAFFTVLKQNVNFINC